jgi:hypothetical protein
MNNKKEILAVMISILVCVLMVCAIGYATTTVGDSVTIGADLTVTSGARIGASATTDHITVLDDGTLFVEGGAEMNGTVYFDGLASISQMDFSSGLITGSMLQVGGTTSVSYSRLGAATTSHSTVVSASSDLLISDNLEVDGSAYFDGVVSVSNANGLMIGGGIKLFGGKASPGGTAGPLNCVVGSWYFKAGGTASTSLYYCATTGEWDDISGF